MEKTRPMGLGRGLSALMGEDVHVAPMASAATSVVTENAVQFVPVLSLVPSPYQPRRVFDESALADLVHSIQEKGILQPLLVRKNPKNPVGFEIIAGERRFRAAQKAGLKTVPVLIKEMSNQSAVEVALIENLQREDLNPLEEAESYKRLLDEFHYTQESLSKVVGKSRSHLANMMRLLDLPDGVKDLVEQKELTMGHARALLTAKDPIGLAQLIVTQGLSVRQTEKMASEPVPAPKAKKPAPQPDADILSLEKQLSALMKANVKIKWNGKNKGAVTIQYESLEKLDEILQKLLMTETKKGV